MKIEHCPIRYQKPVPEKFGIPNCMPDAPENGTGFLVPVFGADFWHVCHWHYVPVIQPLAARNLLNVLLSFLTVNCGVECLHELEYVCEDTFRYNCVNSDKRHLS